MADGSIIIDTKIETRNARADVKNLESALGKVNKELDIQNQKLAEAEAKLWEMTKDYREIAMQAGHSDADIDVAIQNNPQWSAAYADIENYSNGVSMAEQRQAELNNQLAVAQSRLESLASSEDRAAQSASEVGTQGSEAMTETAVGAESASASIDRAASALEKFTNRVIGLVKRVFIFSAITMALRHVRNWFSEAAQSNDEFAAAIARLKAALANLATPIMNTIIPALAKLVNIIASVIQVISSLVSAIFGGGGVTAALNEEEEAISGVGGAAGKASKQLAAFDEINQLTDNSGGSNGASVAELATDNMDNPFAAIKEWMDESGITDAIERLKDAFGNLKAAFDKFKNSPAYETLGKILNLLVVGGLILAIDTLADLFQLIADILNGDLNSALLTLNDLLVDLTLGPLSILAGIIDSIFGTDLKGTVEYWINFLKSDVWKEAWFGGMAKHFSNAWDFIKEEFSKGWERISSFFSIVGDWIGQAWTDFWNFIGGVIDGLGEAIYAAGQGIKTFFTETLPRWFTDAVAFIVDEFNKGIDRIKNAFNAVVRWFDTAIQDIGNFFVNLWNGIKEIWETVSTWFETTVINPVRDAWETATSAIGEFFTGLWRGIKSGVATAMNAVIGAIESAINWCIDAINGILSGINSVVGAVGDLFGADWNIGQIGHVSLGRIPALAQGGVIPANNAFLAVLGDQKSGTNIEAPLDTLVAAFNQALDARGQQRIVLELDRRELGYAVVDVYNMESQRVGLRLGGATV